MYTHLEYNSSVCSKMESSRKINFNETTEKTGNNNKTSAGEKKWQVNGAGSMEVSSVVTLCASVSHGHIDIVPI